MRNNNEPQLVFPKPTSTGRRRVVVTGAGIVTSLGIGWVANAAGFRVGTRAFSPIQRFDVSRQRVRFASQVRLPELLPTSRLGARRAARMEHASRLLLFATHEAWAQSGWGRHQRLPLVLGTTSAGMGFGEQYYVNALQKPANQCRQPTRVTYYQPQQHALDLADAFAFTGPTTVIANACASGANAIGHAWELIRDGRADRALAGGYDGLSQLVFAGFDALQALSSTPSRPFAADRTGLSLGEGAGMVCLESLESAAARGASILGELCGYGAATDVHHLTQPHPEGRAAAATMQRACESAEVTPSQIDYINAHGTGTALNDSAEALAIQAWAGPVVSRLRVSSTKACIGHLLGAAGAVETVLCLMCLNEQWLPPQPDVFTADPLCQFQIPRQPTDAQVQIVLTNSFGFGGANASLVLRRWP